MKMKIYNSNNKSRMKEEDKDKCSRLILMKKIVLLLLKPRNSCKKAKRVNSLRGNNKMKLLEVSD